MSVSGNWNTLAGWHWRPTCSKWAKLIKELKAYKNVSAEHNKIIPVLAHRREKCLQYSTIFSVEEASVLSMYWWTICVVFISIRGYRGIDRRCDHFMISWHTDIVRCRWWLANIAFTEAPKCTHSHARTYWCSNEQTMHISNNNQGIWPSVRPVSDRMPPSPVVNNMNTQTIHASASLPQVGADSDITLLVVSYSSLGVWSSGSLQSH